MDFPYPRTPDRRTHGIVARLRAWWLAKMIGTVTGMGMFFAAYFWLLRHPQNDVTLMPFTAVDRLIEFQPQTLPIYLSLWLYVSLGPALLLDRRELLSYGLAAIGLSLVGLGCFFMWPTAVPPVDVDWSQHPAFVFLKSADAAGNACPSLHAAFAVFTAIGLERTLRPMRGGRSLRVLSWVWCVGIVHSAIATRQHVFLDVVAGVALGTLVAIAYLRWLRRVQPAAVQC